MAIQETVNGVTKTYRYYPYDRIEVGGRQVREVWFNGVKYYPEANGGVWGVRQTVRCRPRIGYRCRSVGQTVEMQTIGTIRLSMAFVGTFDTSKYSVRGWTSNAPTTLMSLAYNNLDIRVSSLKLIAKVQIDFDETATRDNPSRYIAFNRNRLTQEGQAIFDEMSAGTVYQLPFYNDYQSYGTSDDALAQSTNLPSMGHGNKIFAFSDRGASGSYSYRYHLGSPIIRFDLDYDPNNIPSSSYWAVDKDGSQYPFSFCLGHKSSPRAFVDNGFTKSKNSYIRVNYADDEDPIQYWESFNPVGGSFSSDDLLPLPS